MDIFLVLIVIVILLVLVGLVLGKITWNQAITYIIVIALVAVVIWLLLKAVA
jgi:hypothetical protein